MDKALVRFLMGEGSQRRKSAIEQTKRMASEIRLSNSARSIDETIGYLIKKNIRVQYKGIE